ncbi:hypothetical protein Tco_1337563 [Tanacetum coccineum]
MESKGPWRFDKVVEILNITISLMSSLELKVHVEIIKKDSEIVKEKVERNLCFKGLRKNYPSDQTKRPFTKGRDDKMANKCKECALDAEIRIILLEEVQSHREHKYSKVHSVEVLER